MTILASISGRERANRTLEIASDLATAYDDDLVVLYVVRTEEYRAQKSARDVSRDEAAENAVTVAQRFVDQTIGDGAVSVEPRGRVGDVADETLAEADDVDPRYLVIGGRRRSPTGKAVFGSSTQEILLNADCPVVSEMRD